MDVILDRGSTPLTSRTKKGTLQEFLSFYTGLFLVDCSDVKTENLWFSVR